MKTKIWTDLTFCDCRCFFLNVCKCAATVSSPADFGPARWNGGRLRVPHLNQKLRAEEEDLINKTRADGQKNALIKTDTQTHTDIRSSLWLSLPPKSGHQSPPPTCLTLLVSNTHTQMIPPVQTQSCSQMRGPSAPAWCLCGGLGFHWAHSGFAPSFPAARGSRTGLRPALSYCQTCTNTNLTVTAAGNISN